MRVDHVIPRALGGPDHVWNYVPASDTANHKKLASFPPFQANGILYMNKIYYGRKVSQELGDASRRPQRRPLAVGERNEQIRRTIQRNLEALPSPSLGDLRGGRIWLPHGGKKLSIPAIEIEPGRVERFIVGTSNGKPTLTFHPSELLADRLTLIALAAAKRGLDPASAMSCLLAQRVASQIAAAPETAIRGAGLVREVAELSPTWLEMGAGLREQMNLAAEASGSREDGITITFFGCEGEARTPPWERRVRASFRATIRGEGRRWGAVPFSLLISEVTSLPNDVQFQELPSWSDLAPAVFAPVLSLGATYASRITDFLYCPEPAHLHCLADAEILKANMGEGSCEMEACLREHVASLGHHVERLAHAARKALNFNELEKGWRPLVPVRCTSLAKATAKSAFEDAMRSLRPHLEGPVPVSEASAHGPGRR